MDNYGCVQVFLKSEQWHMFPVKFIPLSSKIDYITCESALIISPILYGKKLEMIYKNVSVVFTILINRTEYFVHPKDNEKIKRFTRGENVLEKLLEKMVGVYDKLSFEVEIAKEAQEAEKDFYDKI